MQAGEFFVVGGPVQSDRPCYIERSADGELLSSIADQRFSYVLSPRATGKSSLMARTIRRLRREGQLAAVVDLTQIGARGEGTDAGRWYYSIAYRIVRDLRLKVDLQYWWQEKSALLGDQRLVEFFWEIVLTHTTAPITVFIDEAERATDLPFSLELFSAIRSCYQQRVTEPDYARLNFVVMGVATAAQLCPNAGVSPFIDGQAIELKDFTLTECYQLAAGFGLDATVGRSLIERIYTWTSGQPYLTQKIARGVARKGGRLADVDRVVQEQFLATGTSQEEPLLNHIRVLLAEGAPKARHALARLVKLAQGVEVPAEPGSDWRELLELAGIVTVDGTGKLAFRNQIFARVFGERWAKAEMPPDWRMRAAAVAGLVVAVLLPYWYTQVLPRPYINTLSVVTEDYAVAEDAYRRLHRLPGFAARADRLLADVMVRRSERTSTITGALAADAVIRESLGMPELADEMIGKYWLRRSAAAMHRGDRDEALLYAMEARRDAPDIAVQTATELIGSDYVHLQRTFRLPQAPISWDVDWERNELVVVDQAHRVERLPLAPVDASNARGNLDSTVSERLTAVQHVPVSRELVVDDEGTADAFNLFLTVQHARASDLQLTLTAPSGAQATLPVPQPRVDQHELIFSARDSALEALADEQVLGRWQLTLVDRRSGETGVLASWGLQFGADRLPWLDTPEQGAPLPDPVRTEQVDIALSPAGRIAIAQPTRAGAAGSLAVWDLRSGELVADLQGQSAPPEQVVISAATHRVLAVTGNEAAIWDFGGEAPVARLTTDTEFALPPAMSSDGAFVVIAETIEDEAPLFSLLDVETGELLASFEGVAAVRQWVLGPGAGFLAVVDGAGRALVLDPRADSVRTELRHYQDVIRLLPTASHGNLVTVDADGAVHDWQVDFTEDGAIVSDNWLIGTTTDPASVSVSAAADGVAYSLDDGLVVVQDLHGARQPQYFRAAGAATPVTRIAPRADRLLTASGALFRLWSVEPSSALASIDRDLSAVALDSGGEVAAFGFRGGYVQAARVSELDQTPARLDSVNYIGHRGMVTSLAVNAARNIIASGGSDGVVRIWDLTTGAPSPQFLRHPMGPIRALTLSNDGNLVVSAAEYSARVWETQTGDLRGEIPVDGAALAAALSEDGGFVAVGDTAGNVFFGRVREPQSMLSARAHAAVLALAISADGTLMASGDAAGNLQLWDTATADTGRATYLFPDAVSWVDFGVAGDTVYARSGAWAHELKINTDGFAVVASRLLPTRVGPDAVPVVMADGTLRFLTGPAIGEPGRVDLTISEPRIAPLPADSPLLARDWPAILGLELDRSTGTVRIAR